jgi:hypothetical protein
MSFVFNKHNPKSFVVRGDIIDNLKSRQQFISKLTGKCVYNTRLKFGSGLLVPINEKNEQFLNEYKHNNINNTKQLQSVMIPYETSETGEINQTDQISESNVDNKITDSQNLDDILFKLLNESDTEDDNINKLNNGNETVVNNANTYEIVNNKTKKILNTDNKKKNDKQNNKNQHKEKQVSIIDSKMSQENKDNKTNDRSKNLTRNNDKDLRDSRENRDSKDRKRHEERDSRNRSRSSRRRHDSDTSSDSYSSDSNSSSSESSDYSGDSSEDERIQETIRRKGQRPDRKKVELNDDDVDSDHEDIVTLTRRIRYLSRKVKSIEEYLRR